MNSTLRINCYVRIIKPGLKETGYVGRLGGICRDHYHTLYGVDWASEYHFDELERITPAEYHASPENLKLSKGWMNRRAEQGAPTAGQLDTTIVFNSKTGKYHAWTGKQFIGAYDTILAAGQELLKRGGNGSPTVYG